MQDQTNFQQTETQLMGLQTESGMERLILKHWRSYEPKRVESLMAQGILRKALKQKAEALFEMQLALEKTESLNPVLAQMEAWNRLMRPEDDAKEEAEAWGMTLEEYQNRA